MTIEDIERISRTEQIPNTTLYDFLYDRNKGFMNYIALSFDKKKITFEELHTRIDEYSKALLNYGIQKGDRVAICVVNTPESIYLLYALNKIGAVTIGLSLLNNEYKMARDIEMSNPILVVTADLIAPKLKNICKEKGISMITYSPIESISNPIIKGLYNCKQLFGGNMSLDRNSTLKKVLKNNSNEIILEKSEHIPEKITDIMFTGGSTGTHKSVLLNENGANCVVKGLDYIFDLEPGMKHLGNIPFGHMVFGRLVMHYVLSSNLEFALTLNMLPDKFLDELIITQADGAMGGPVHWNTLINNPKIKKDILKNLKQAISGGEMYIPEQRRLAEKELAYAGALTGIGDGLGMTETWAPININVSGKNTPDTVGFPLPFVKEKIVDPTSFKELGNNQPGLLLVNSPTMMLGYSDEEENQKVFYIDENGVKWLNTGDIVMRTDNGEIKFAGRKKRNFVSGVDNIYPEQVETLVATLPEIKQICVTKIFDEEQQNLPKYHIVLNDPDFSKDDLEKKIIELIKNTLGLSACPGYIEYYNDELPRTDNGKINASLLESNDLQENSNQKKLVKLR